MRNFLKDAKPLIWICICIICNVLINVWDQDIKSEINSVLNPRGPGPEGSLIGIPGMLLASICMKVTIIDVNYGLICCV